jgi:hypothetical protein
MSAKRLQVEGRLRVIETTGTWGVYAGERILLGTGMSFRDDLGVKIRETFGPDEHAESFEVPRVRVTIEVLDQAEER